MAILLVDHRCASMPWKHGPFDYASVAQWLALDKKNDAGQMREDTIGIEGFSDFLST